MENNNKQILTDRQKRYMPIKRTMDIILSGSAIVILSPVLLGLSVAIKLDSLGPVLFKQKRVGKDKELFEIWKFRTMRIDTPKDMPTHMLSNPEQYITKVGKFLRKTSLDELPQIFQIFTGKMSILGPRPALWNQYDLIKERDKYGANSIKPGLTGWAQINGRDELEIPVKAKLDGFYVENIGILMDIKCFFGTIGTVLSAEGVVEGGTGNICKEKMGDNQESNVSSKRIKKRIVFGGTITSVAIFVSTFVVAVLANCLRNKKVNEMGKNLKSIKRVRLITVIAGILSAFFYKRNKKKELALNNKDIEEYKEQKRNKNHTVLHQHEHMKILVVCQYYYPEDFQINDICEELVKRGSEVTVLTGLPNYPTGIIPEEYLKGRRKKEIINGVNVVRCYEIGRKKGAIGLAFNYISYCLSAKKKVKELDGEFDLVFLYQLSPILMGIPACDYKKKYKVPMLLYCCDLWPESMKLIVKDDNSLLFKLVKEISSNIYRCADKIIVQTKYFYPYFSKVHGISKENLIYLPQFANEEYLEQQYNNENGIVDFVFLGNIGIAQNVDKVIEAVDKIRNLEHFQIHIVGDGSCLEDLKILVSDKKLESKIKFYGRRPIEEMPKFYQIADVCLVSLSSENLTGLTLPSKVQGYMAAGKMIIGMVDGATKEVIEDSNCGICVPAGNSELLAKAMQSVIRNPEKYRDCGENGRLYFRKHFAKKEFMNTLEKMMREMVG